VAGRAGKGFPLQTRNLCRIFRVCFQNRPNKRIFGGFSPWHIRCLLSVKILGSSLEEAHQTAPRKTNNIIMAQDLSAGRPARGPDRTAVPALRIWQQIVGPGDLVFDVGANVGNKAAELLECGARIVCVEPQPHCAEKIRARFHGRPDVTIVPNGVAGQPGTLQLSICRDKDYISTFAKDWKTGRFAGEHWDETVDVEVTTLDALIQTHGRPAFCKIDVEGFELEVLSGLSQRIPFLSFEYSAEFQSVARACLVRLNQLGYRYFNFSFGETEEFDHPDWLSSRELLDYLASRADPLFWGDIYARAEYRDNRPVQVPDGELWPAGTKAPDSILKRLAATPIASKIKSIGVVSSVPETDRGSFKELFPNLTKTVEFDAGSEAELPAAGLLVLNNAAESYRVLQRLTPELRKEIKLICAEATLGGKVGEAPGLEDIRTFMEPDFVFLGFEPRGVEMPVHGTAVFININQRPKVSVIVSTYNSEKFMRACLDDLERQTIAQELEIIVLDSGSQQNERAIVEEYQQRYENIVYVRTEREPLYAAWNRAVKMAKGRYITNANSDDAHRADALELLAGALDAHPQAQLSYGDYYTCSVPNDTFENPHIIRRVVHPLHHPATLMFYCVTGCHPMWRRGIFSRIGLFDTQYIAPGDYEFLLRFAKTGLRAVRVPEFLSLFYQNAQGLSFQSAARSKYEGNLIYAKYRAEMPIERLYAVNQDTATLGWVALGNMAMSFKVPWIDNFSQDSDFAVTCYERALACSPGQPAALNNLAVALVLKGQPERAKSLISALPPAQQDQFLANLKTGTLKLVEVNVPPALEPLEYRPPGQPAAIPAIVAKPAKPKPLPGPVPKLPVRWIADFLVPGEYSRDSIDAAAGLEAYIPALGTLDQTETYSESYDHELSAPIKAALAGTHEKFNFVIGGISIAARSPKAFCVPDGAMYSIGRTAIEADAVPQHWVTVCNQMREIWVPSNFSREIFARSGVEPSKLRVIPTSVDAAAFNPEATTPANLPGRAAWNFLFCDEWSERSGWEEMLNAYFAEFSASDDVCLYLGSRLPGKTRAESLEKIRQQAQQIATSSGSTARYEVVAFPDSDLPGFLQACDSVVLPAHAEGWGRNQMQAMLMEKLVITTGWGAHMDFCRADNCSLIDFKPGEIHASESELLPLRGLKWAMPSAEQLRALLREAQRNPEAARVKGRGHRVAIAAAYDRLHVGREVANHLCEIEHALNNAACEPAKPHITELEPLGRGNLARDLQITWEGSFLDYGSLSHVNRELTGALSAHKQLQITPVGPLNQTAPVEFKNFAARVRSEAPRKTDVTVRHGWPPNWKRPATGAWVLIQPWEFGALPITWLKELALVDEIWAPTEYVRRVYVDSGVHPAKVKIVPNGVDAAKFQPGLQPWPLATNKKFKFLFVGGTIQRKGPDVLLKSYLESFTAADDVCLVIKDFGGQSVYQGQTMAKEIEAARLNPNAPEILYLTDELPADAMPRVYAACQCLVHPYRGEGFGLPVLEAMACGLPVVVTAGGATDDFAADGYACRVPALRTPIDDKIGELKLCRKGWWLEPDAKALAERLRWIFAHQEEAQTLGRNASDYVRREWTWERAARIASRRLQDLVTRKSAETVAVAERRSRKAGPLALPEAAFVGQPREARELLAKKDYKAAWNSVLAATNVRPFHCEGYLLLAEIARAAGDMEQAKMCVERARQLAPNWKPAKQLLKSLSNAGRTIEWMALPELPKTPRLTVCLITRNEEQFLGSCLESIREIAHQIIVVDTGSTDATVDIATQFRAEVYHFPWCDDFSAARNEALKHATGDWILALDADEELLPEHRQTILKEIQETAVMAYRLPIIDKGKEKEGCSYVPRLFRNAPGLFYVGRVHEQVFTSIEVRRQEWGLENRLGKSALLHHGYTTEIVASRDKVARNLRLLELAMEELPNEPNLVMNYGLELVRSGQLQAGLENTMEAFQLLSRLPASQVVPELRETLLTQLSTHLMTAKAFGEIVKLWQTPLARMAEMTASQHFLLGLAHIELGHYAEAAEQLRQCIAKRHQPALTPINPEILKAGPNHCLALALMASKDEAGAAQCFRAALVDDPKSVRARFDFARFQFQQGQPVEALKMLNELVTEKAADLAVWQLGGQIALSRPEYFGFAREWTAEALKHFPQHPAITLQRAEALLLTQDVEGALPLWTAAHSAKSARHLAALVICEAVTGKSERRFAPGDEPVVSQEVLKWYRLLLAAGASGLVTRFRGSVENLRVMTPSFVQAWEAAAAEAQRTLAAAQASPLKNPSASITA
jgi:FkbM family methyltransferase